MFNQDNRFLGDMEDFFDSHQEQLNQPTAVIRQTKTDKEAVLSKFYGKLEELGLNLDELKPILECEDNTLILSGAGAGKTTALTLKIIRDLLTGTMMTVQAVNTVHGLTYIQTPAKILVSTFLKTGTEDLQRALQDWCQKLGIVGVDFSAIQFKTIHAEVKDAITKMLSGNTTTPNGDSTYTSYGEVSNSGVRIKIIEDTKPFIRSIANKYGIRSNNATTRSLSADEVNEIATIMNYARNRLDEKRYEHPLMQDYGIDALLLDTFLQDFKVLRQASGGMDFEDMQEMLLEALRVNPNVEKFILDRYDYIFVDEFQDTSQLQYEILKYYFRGANRVIVVGDTDQCIYSWRGSDNEIIRKRFEEDFQPTVLSLTTNYRCKSNILKAIKPSIMLNGSPHSKDLKSSKEGGELQVVYDGDVNHLVQSIKADIVRNYTVGVLSRTNADLLIPALILEIDGNIDFGLSKSVNMNSRMAKQIFGMFDLVTKRITNDFESLLRVFVRRSNWDEVERLCAVLSMNRDTSIYNIPESDLRYSTPNLYPFLQGLRSAYEVGKVEAYLYILGVLENKVYAGSSVYVQKAKELTRLVYKLITEHEKLKNMDITELDIMFRSVLPERLTNRIKFSSNAKVKLTTVHESKGKEWDSVYIYNNINGVFPNQVGGRDLTEEEFEEERRVHYIAWTRAREKLTVYTSSYNEGVFLKECDLSYANSTSNTVEEKSIPIFKRKKTELELDSRDKAKQLVRHYVEELRSTGTITDDRVANLEIVLNSYGEQELAHIAHDEYAVGHQEESTELVFQTLDNICKRLADDIIINGTSSYI